MHSLLGFPSEMSFDSQIARLGLFIQDLYDLALDDEQPRDKWNI
jgi:hypothetical protein